MRRNAKRACRANKFLLVPKPRFIGPDNFWGDDCPNAVEVINLLVEKIQVHREEIADAQDFLNQFVHQHPEYAHLLPKQGPLLGGYLPPVTQPEGEFATQ